MAEKISFDLVSPERLLLSEEAEMVGIPGTEGDMGVMSGHMPLITTLRPGVIDVSGGATKGDLRFYVTGGFAEVTASKLTVLAEVAIPVSELDAAALGALVQKTEQELADSKTDLEHGKKQSQLECLKQLNVGH